MNMRNPDALMTTQALPAFADMQGNGAGWAYQDYVDSSTKASGVDWAGYWRSIVKRRWRILLVTAIVTVIAACVAQSIQPVFRSTTTLLIESGKTKILSIEEVYNGVSQDREYYQTQVEILRSRDVALRTVTATRLWDEPEFDPRKPARSPLTRIREYFNPPPTPTWTPQLLAEATLGRFIAALTIEPVRLSQLVKISFEARDPYLAAKMADALATSFIESDRDARERLNVNVTGQLQDRLSALRDKLLQSEQDLQKYRESAGLVSISGSQGIAGQQMSEISQRLIVARVRRTELESVYQQVERDPASSAAVLNGAGVMEARNRVSLAQLRIEELTRTLGDQNTKVIEARTALEGAQRQLGSAQRAVVSSMKAELQAARENERALQAALDSSRSAVQGVNRQEFQLGVLEREVQTNKQLYELLLSRTKETGLSTNLQGAVARIVDAASPAGAALRPNKPQIVLVAMMLCLSICALVSILVDKFANTFEGSDQAENRLHFPVLATLPEVRAPAGQSITRLFLDDPKSRHADSIRNARTSMLLSNFVVAHKLVLVTSALAGEGKTTLCTNLAFAHAQTRRTLLIDCDLRSPQIGARLGLPDDAKGLSDLVLGSCLLKECVHAISGSPLLVMPAGTLPANPEELLLSVAFQDALRSLSNRVDIVFIDSPPIADSSDALIISQHVNDTIFVVKARDTPHVQAQRGLEQLRRAGASILGLVLTNVDTKETSWSPLRRGGYGTAANDEARTLSEPTAFGA